MAQVNERNRDIISPASRNIGLIKECGWMDRGRGGPSSGNIEDCMKNALDTYRPSHEGVYTQNPFKREVKRQFLR
jgi:hypothetical protein